MANETRELVVGVARAYDAQLQLMTCGASGVLVPTAQVVEEAYKQYEAALANTAKIWASWMFRS